MLDQQSRLQQTQMQLSAGKKLLAPSDDPAAAARILDLNQGIKQTEQYQSNINVARQRLTLEDGVLQNTTDILQRINELGVQGLNATNSPSDRTAIAVEMEGLNQQLLGYANTKNANGEYLFSGFKSATQSFSKNTIVAGSAMTAAAQTGTITINGVPTASITTTTGGPGSRALVVSAINAISNQTGVIAIDTNSDSDGIRLEAADGRNIAAQFTGTLDSASTGVSAAAVAAAGPLTYVAAYNYAGDTNQRPIQIGETRQVADGDYGSNIFGMSTGSLLSTTVLTPGSITNIFEAINKFATDLRADTPNSASLDDISSGLNKILTVQASVGTRLNVLDNQEGHNADFVLDMKTVLSATEDLDYTEAISKFNQQTLSLQAAQQAFAQVKKLSLFNYL
jgi:flagellar hook-associated protein 3 FlgL